MAYDRRQQRRQGVVYGPPRSTARFSDTGALIGRFLGLGILVLALGVLAAGALAFVGDRPGQTATPVRSALVAASVSFLPGALGASLAVTQMPATLTPTLGPIAPSFTPPVVPSAPPPLVQIGAGYVTFGTASDDQFHIVDPRSTFAVTERIVLSAYLTRPADSADLHVQIVKLDGAVEGGERVVLDEAVTPIVRNAQILGRRLRPDVILDGAGIYIVRYLRGADVMAEGSFQVTA